MNEKSPIVVMLERIKGKVREISIACTYTLIELDALEIMLKQQPTPQSETAPADVDDIPF